MRDLTASVAALLREAYDQAHAAGKHRLTVAIDGRCASGKTTLAAELSPALADIGCTVLHMDDFFLRPEQRTPERLAMPGENIDHERFLAQILLPLSAGDMIVYQPFSCRTQALDEAISLLPTPIMLIEGSYACHPTLRRYYDLCIFLTTSPETQMTRILARNGDAAEVFRTRWIPMEEAYIAACKPQAHSVIFQT